MTALLINKIIYGLFLFEFVVIPVLIVCVPVCAILDIKIKRGSRNKNYLGKGEKNGNKRRNNHTRKHKGA